MRVVRHGAVVTLRWRLRLRTRFGRQIETGTHFRSKRNDAPGQPSVPKPDRCARTAPECVEPAPDGLPPPFGAGKVGHPRFGLSIPAPRMDVKADLVPGAFELAQQCPIPPRDPAGGSVEEGDLGVHPQKPGEVDR